jgi:hypothetical protein
MGAPSTIQNTHCQRTRRPLRYLPTDRTELRKDYDKLDRSGKTASKLNCI